MPIKNKIANDKQNKKKKKKTKHTIKTSVIKTNVIHKYRLPDARLVKVF